MMYQMAYEYQFDSEKCWYKEVCNHYGTNKCYPGCLRFMEMHYLMNNSGIPAKCQYQIDLYPEDEDLDAFMQLKEIKDNIIDFIEQGCSLYLYSENTGNGKTSWAIKLMQKYFDSIWAGNGFRCRGVFIHVPTFLTKIKEGISRKDEDFELLRSRLLEADLVIWDDIASGKLGDFDHTNLITYIDQRKLNRLSNIYTGNIGGEQLSEALGVRLASRVWKDSLQVEIIGADRRGFRI